MNDRMYRYRHLMVGLTRTGSDGALVRYAAMLARLGTVVEARFVHVLPPDPAAHVHDQALAEMQDLVQHPGADLPPGVQVHCDALKGPLVDRLLEYAAEQEIDLLLLGHRRDHPGRYALARRLAMKAPCSVWVVPGASPPAIRRILVPIDFSEPAADALQVAAALTKLAGASECVALHVYFNEARSTYEGYDEVIRGQEQRALEQFVAPLNLHKVEVRPLFEEGANVAHVINRVVARESCDLVVMATRGRSRSAAILLGSVTEEAIIETQVPLLVVKHFGARLGVLQALLDRGFRRRHGPQFD